MQLCREHRDSRIVSHGFFASPFAEDEDLTEVQGNVKGLKGVYGCLANNSMMVVIESKWFSIYCFGTRNNIGISKESRQTVVSLFNKWFPL